MTMRRTLGRLMILPLVLFVLLGTTHGNANDNLHDNARTVIELTDGNFELKTQASSGSMTASWFLLFKGDACPHCERISPLFDELSTDDELQQTYGVLFGQVDVPTNSLTSSRFSIRSFPTLHYLHNNRLYPYRGTRTVNAMKIFLITVQTHANTFRDYESYYIPSPVSHITQLVHTFIHVRDMASLKVGAVGGLAVTTLFGLTFVMLMGGLILVGYLGMLLYSQSKVEEEPRTAKKIN